MPKTLEKMDVLGICYGRKTAITSNLTNAV